jgi:hypothetical protein
MDSLYAVNEAGFQSRGKLKAFSNIYCSVLLTF